MSQKLLYLISFVLVLGMAGNALAVDTDWNNASGDRRWDNPLNWSTGAVPTADDKASIRNDGVGPIIDSITTAVCDNIPVGDWGFTNTLDITGGSLTTNNWFIIGYGSADEGTFNVSGGTTTVVGSGTDLTVGRAGIGHLNISAGSIEVGDRLYVGSETSGTGYITMTGGLITINDDLYIGDDGTAHINMSGGLITIADDLRAYSGTVHMNVSGGEISIGDRLYVGNGTGGEAHLTMTGGSITLGGLMAVGRDGASGEVHLDGGTLDIGYWLEMSSRASIDITGGTLIITMDDITDDNGTYRSIRPWIDDGRITAYGGIGTLNVDYNTNPGKTTLTAVLTPASEPQPEHEETGVYRMVVLSWTPGEFANMHDVYFGTSFADVNEATTASEVYLGRQSETTYAPDRLELGQDYYWRVDEVNGANAESPWIGEVWSFEVEPVSYPIAAGLTVTASSQNTADEGPEKTIDGSGLESDDTHSQASDTMWLSAESEPGETWIQYEFDQLYSLSELVIWNHNTEFETSLGFGIKEAKIEISVDGQDFTPLVTTELAQADKSTVDAQGALAKAVRITAMSNWGSSKQYGLSEIQFLAIPLAARKMSPADGTILSGLTAELSWYAGRQAEFHDVYIDTDMQAVINGNAPVERVNTTQYTAEFDLLDATYYWKVNEVNEAEVPAVWEGPVQSFTTTAFLVLENFDDYNASDNQIWWSWKDGLGYVEHDGQPAYAGNGTGSAVGDETTATFMEMVIVKGGTQSMPVWYDNNQQDFAKYSETALALPAGKRDWTTGSPGELSLWFRGEAANIVERLYVAVANTAVVYHEDQNATQLTDWTEWVIPLETLAGQGVSLTNVDSIAIGLGTRGNATIPGGAGKMYFDEIRLYPDRSTMVSTTVPDVGF